MVLCVYFTLLAVKKWILNCPFVMDVHTNSNYFLLQVPLKFHFDKIPTKHKPMFSNYENAIFFLAIAALFCNELCFQLGRSCSGFHLLRLSYLGIACHEEAEFFSIAAVPIL